jgi:hypothetical protein
MDVHRRANVVPEPNFESTDLSAPALDQVWLDRSVHTVQHPTMDMQRVDIPVTEEISLSRFFAPPSPESTRDAQLEPSQMELIRSFQQLLDDIGMK